ncbi:MAG TPA: choice-of-anchor D domain-containing protein [Myxococcaceae bacterium]|nr:choice-of-anchor D domain-containing protein [Myxococcaceae bacterium]
MVGLRWVCVAACLLAVVGVGCERPTSQRAKSGLVTTPEALEFGPSAVGVARRMKVRLLNRGRAPFRVHGMTSSLANVRVEAFEDFELGAGAERELEVVFTPDVEGPVRGVLEVLTDASNVGQEGVAPLELGGLGVKALVEVGVEELDFGNVELGQVGMRELLISNPTEVESPVRLFFGGTEADEFSSSVAAASLVLKPGEKRTLPVAFKPERLGAAQAHARLEVCGSCEPAMVALRGTGIAALMDVSPLRVDFGRISPGATAEERIVVRNLGTEPMVYGGVRLLDDGGGVYSMLREPLVPGNVLAPGAVVEVRVGFTPASRGAAPAGLVEVDVHPMGSPAPGPKVSLVGEGGAACVVLQPASLDFGEVAEGMSATREVQVSNRCGREVLLSDLKLTTKSGGYFMLAQAPSSLPIPAGQKVGVGVTFLPRARGPGEAELSARVLTGSSTATEVVRVLGTGRVFEPCQYALEPAEVDFGMVPVGSEVVLGVAVRNVGTSDCYLAGMRLAGGSDEAFRADAVGNSVLAPGQRALLLARFLPRAEGDSSGMVEAWVNHPSNGHPLVPLRGQGVRGCFSVQPTQLDFGVTRLACGPRERELVLYNECVGPVTLAGVGLEGDVDDYRVAHPFFFPQELPADSEHRVKVTYAPKDDGRDAAALRFDLGGSRYTVGLVGEGEEKNEQTDAFIQQSEARVDVLFLVDNSGSMMDEQQSLGQNFAAFLSHAAEAGVDYHVAVTTTGLEASSGGWAVCPGGADGGENGRFFPANGETPRIITSTTPNAEALFAHNTEVGVCHWNERGLEAMYRALSEPLVNGTDDSRTPLPMDGNAGFLRDDAKLAVIAVSDEEDFSPQPVEFYETFLLGLKGQDRAKVIFSAIVGPKDLSTCPKASSSGGRYIQLAEATGGVVESICTPNWASSLERLSESAFGPNRSFPLSEEPEDASRIVVRVDGVPVTSGWSYDPVNNSILFEVSATPPPGAIIEVTYPVGC